ncbi:MAG: hypothetical protein ABIN97_00085, partial [Ginsengibacter sp.]
MVWIFLFINALFVFFIVALDTDTIGGGVGSVHKNAPFVIQELYAGFSIICLLMTTAFMNATANRDFQFGMYQFVFSSPIRKRDYYFGKFIGATILSVIPMLGISLGALAAPVFAHAFNMAPPERFGEVIWSGHLQGLLAFGIPNVIISGVLLYALAIIFRSNIISFIGAMFILVFYEISDQFMQDIQKEWLANLLDPFGSRPFDTMTKYMTVDEKNMRAVTLHGELLTNRLLWLGISLIILITVYFRFSFTIRKEKIKKEKTPKTVTENITSGIIFQPAKDNFLSLNTFLNLVKFETKAIIKNPTFIIIVVIGLIHLIIALVFFTGSYGTGQYPVTYDVIDSIKKSFFIYLIAIITFYPGVLVWKERDAKINEIQDSTPIKTSLLFISKLVAMIISIALILSCTIVMGMIAQTVFGYYRYQLDVYFKSLLVLYLLSLSFFVIIALLFHYLINNRYIAYFAFVTFIILNLFIWGVFKVDTNMVKFGFIPGIIYSDMNGFGPFVQSVVWFNIYWFIFSILIGFVILSFYIRGKETGFKHRLNNAKYVLLKNKIPIVLCAFVFVLCGSFVYYNTKVLNKYDSEKVFENKRIDYEKKYKTYEHLIQPRFYKYNYAIDLMPYERSMKATIEAFARNISNQSISELHLTMPEIPDSVSISITGSNLKLNDTR